MAETADVVVVGLGAMGAATLHALARAGVRAVGIDRYAPPHTLGSTHGESRITRLAVGEGAVYAPLVRRSHEIWRELEAETGEQLMLTTGGLILGPRQGGALMHGHPDFVSRTVAVAEQQAIPHEVLDAGEITRRFPQLELRGDEHACYEPSAGVVFPERCVAAQLRQAERRGATLRLDERVLSVRAHGSGAEVVTDRGTLQAGRVVLTAGPWLPELLDAHPTARLAQVHRQTLHWFAVEDGRYAPDRFPIFIWMHGDGEEDAFYGFPTLPGEHGRVIKVGTEVYASTTTPDSVQRVVDPAESAALFRGHVAGRLRGVTDRCVRALTCLYTVTPDSGFLVDTLPDAPAVLLASACSGHGFKHSAGLGEVLAAHAMDGVAADPAFALSRFAEAV